LGKYYPASADTDSNPDSNSFAGASIARAPGVDCFINFTLTDLCISHSKPGRERKSGAKFEPIPASLM
jgi:hypothetical protein